LDTKPSWEGPFWSIEAGLTFEVRVSWQISLKLLGVAPDHASDSGIALLTGPYFASYITRVIVSSKQSKITLILMEWTIDFK
jgi:hypothetical protein